MRRGGDGLGEVRRGKIDAALPLPSTEYLPSNSARPR